MSTNTFKYTSRLSNYVFSSQLNTLQFTFETIVVAPTCDNTNVPENNEENNQPSSSRTILSTDFGNGISYGGSSPSDMHWVKMDANQLSLYSRFTNKMIVDGRVIMNANTMAAEVDSTNTAARVTIVTPYFESYVEIDPDFSVLTDYDREENTMECSNNNDDRPWLIPVIVVACVVGVALLIVTGAIIYKKSSTIRLKVLSLKSKSRGSVKMSNR
ncbi:hypothetical protein DFA_00384 [Cavenderia fasciculata]|uniref:ComC supersandwich domain-containing protein n=1 Tax=Cavenderia fasciculata TaxID=261658 RepID=F4PRH1_CACFS|nr:uncharacterized protein DFA_00384 [Cavenderia fasciculata]EGG20523.1 hypothetical protein DFA_00384 [Cavenderia fasciculata]|eukprot:XP_004358373.1 hypothetical protein DFA_00384 [Cavenderia fasciculata]